MMSRTEKKCLYCGEALHGRADKKFCDDQCRSNYHYQQNREMHHQVRKINLILGKNRKILEHILGREKMLKISKKKLSAEGFNFQYITHGLNTSKGQYRFCYEFGYLELDEEKVLIVKNTSLLPVL